jgi:Membrane bound beta barrel domain (DUF5777)
MARRTIEVIVKSRLFHASAALALLLAVAAPAGAQTTDDPDLDVNFAQPDFTLVNLPTTLRLPRFKSAFRVTHRFTRPIGDGDFGDLAGDLFGLDTGAQIGLEYRFGLMRGMQIGIHRTSDRTIEFFTQYEVVAEGTWLPVTISALATMDGTDNFTESYSPGLGAVISRTLGEHGALYLEPIWVNNTNRLPSEVVEHNNSFLLGMGARIRVRPTVYLAFEGAPRVSGNDPGYGLVSFGLEKRSGGHMFQLTVTNGFGTTMGQVARGGFNSEDWHLGFAISRKFF